MANQSTQHIKLGARPQQGAVLRQIAFKTDRDVSPCRVFGADDTDDTDDFGANATKAKKPKTFLIKRRPGGYILHYGKMIC